MQYNPIQPSFSHKGILYEEENQKIFLKKEDELLFFQFKANETNKRMLVVPDASIDIFVQCHDTSPYIHICGTTLSSYQLPLEPDTLYFGVRLKPGIATVLLHESAKLFTNKEIEYKDIFPNNKNIDKIFELKTFHERVTFMKNMLRLDSLMKKDINDLIRWSVDQFYEDPCIKINSWARLTGYSERYLRKLFNEHVGVSPKMFFRILRFQTLLNQMLYQPKADYLDLAEQLGYYDQSHLVNEFKHFSSSTPTQIIKDF